MRIQHNLSAMNAQRNFTSNNGKLGKNLEKLASGFAINRAVDNAAGLAISEKMRAQVTGLNRAEKNAHDGISLIQTTEGALSEVHSMMNRMVELATEAANGIYDDSIDRNALQDEMKALETEIDRIATDTHFNGKHVINGDFSLQAVAEFKGSATATVAGIDLVFEMDEGFQPGVEFSFKNGNPDSVNITNGSPNKSSVEITIDPNKDYSATDIEKLVHNKAEEFLAGGGNTAEESQKLGNLLKDMHIVGKGVSKATEGARDPWFDPDPAKATATPPTTDSLNFQVGVGTGTNDKIKLSLINLDARSLGLDEISVGSEKLAGEAIERINTAINLVSSQRGKLGAVQNRLEYSINSLNCDAGNMSAAESRIRDCDMANEIMLYTKNNILVQASQSMMAQAGHTPEGILRLLQ